jgi:hypothetical protein
LSGSLEVDNLRGIFLSKMAGRPGSYVGTRKVIYPPSKANIKSGDHAARNGGSSLMFPMASNKPETVQ